MKFRTFDEIRASLDGQEGRPSEAPGAEAVEIVVVDDDEGVRSALKLALGRFYKVVLCESARDAVGAVGPATAAVILDVRMPVTNGFEVCERLRARDPDLPVIFHSAHQDAKDPFEIINDHRPFAYVTKGSGLGKLLRVVNEAVVERERRRRRDGVLTLLTGIQEQLDAVKRKLTKLPTSSPSSSSPFSPRPSRGFTP
jgi:DNA-binding NtrC family response regulator